MDAKITFFLLVCGIASALAAPRCSDDEYFQCFKDKTSKYPESREEFDKFCKIELRAVQCAIDLIETCPNSQFKEYLDSFKKEKDLKEWMCENLRDTYKDVLLPSLVQPQCSDEEYFQCFKDKTSKYPNTREEFDKFCLIELRAVQCGIDFIGKCPNSPFAEYLDSFKKEQDLKKWMCENLGDTYKDVLPSLAEPGCSDEEYFQCFKDKTSKYPETREEFDKFCRIELHAVQCAIDFIGKCPNSPFAEYLDSFKKEQELKKWMCENLRDTYKDVLPSLAEPGCSDEEYFQCFKDKTSKYPETREEFDKFCRIELHAVQCAIDFIGKCPNSPYAEYLDSFKKEQDIKKWMCANLRDTYKDN